MVSRSLTIKDWTSSRDLMAVMVVGDRRRMAADSRVGTPPAARAATRSTTAGGGLRRRGSFRYAPRCAGRGVKGECGRRDLGADVATDPEVFSAPAIEP